MAVELESGDFHGNNPNGRLRICRQGMEKHIEPGDLSYDDGEGGWSGFGGDVDMHSFQNQEFKCPAWRKEECATGAGMKEGGGRAWGIGVTVAVCVSDVNCGCGLLLQACAYCN